MELPPWHVGHVVRKLMLAHVPEITRTELAAKSGKRPMTITHLLKTGRSDDETIEAVAQVFNLTALELRQEVERSNQRSQVVSLAAEQRRRASDREPNEVEAEQYLRRLMRLSNSAQTAIFNTIRAFEEAIGLFNNRRSEH